MGKMEKEEMFAISIIALIFSPFILAGRLIRTIGESLGIIERETYEYDPLKDPNYNRPPEPEIEQPIVSETSNTSKPKIGQGFDNPNKLDPNS
jgi:hypothetical protein